MNTKDSLNHGRYHDLNSPAGRYGVTVFNAVMLSLRSIFLSLLFSTLSLWHLAAHVPDVECRLKSIVGRSSSVRGSEKGAMCFVSLHDNSDWQHNLVWVAQPY